MTALFDADPATYKNHPLHWPDRTFVESNCYTDVLIELLHARGDEPAAVLGSLAAADFEGDQWTFFKPDPYDLAELLGVDIHEMMPYRPLPEQITEQLDRGRTLLIEVDSWHLPDTTGTSYRTEHVKTSIAIESIDPEHEVLRYFHGPSLHELACEDYRGLFAVAAGASGGLPPYTELVRFDAGPRRAGTDLRAAARQSLRGHLSRRPADNPFHRFAASLRADLQVLAGADHERYHAYAFATARMAGAAFELCQAHVDWLFGDEAAAASQALRQIVTASKMLVFKLARRRPFATDEIAAELATGWDTAMSALDALAG